MAKIIKVNLGFSYILVNTPWGLLPKCDVTVPEVYDNKKIKVVCQEWLNAQPTVIARNDGTSYLIGVVSDADLATFTSSPDIVEIDQSTAETLGTAIRPQVETITDAAAIIAIMAKLKASQALTAEEDDASNPDNPAKGINKNIAFTDILTEEITEVG